MGDAETEHMVDLVRRLHQEQGMSILFIEHDMDIVFGIAQHITVLDQGRVLADGTPDADLGRPESARRLSGNDRMTAVLRANDIHTFYGKSHILHGVSLEVNEGEIVTVLGRNGAGKTTTVRSLIGLTPPRQGTFEIFGNDTTRWPAHRIAGLGVGYVPEGRKIFGNLTVLENLRVPQARPGPWNLDRVFKLFPRLAERKSQLGRQLSGGEQEMLSIARPLLLNPRLMLLDEPSQGLAPLIVREVMQVVRRMREDGLSVLLIEQNAPLSLSIADRAYILDDGKVVYSGNAADLAAGYRTRQQTRGRRPQGRDTCKLRDTAALWRRLWPYRWGLNPQSACVTSDKAPSLSRFGKASCIDQAVRRILAVKKIGVPGA